MRPASVSVKNLIQLDLMDRLGKVVIHSAREVFLAITFHGVGGQRHDGHMISALFFVLPDNRGCLDPAHFGHLDIHQGQIEAPVPFHAVSASVPFFADNHNMTTFLEQAFCHKLVYFVIFGDQHAQGTLSAAVSPAWGTQIAEKNFMPVFRESANQRVPQLRLGYGLPQVCGQILTPGSEPGLPCGHLRSAS